jgi:hypothetical protein
MFMSREVSVNGGLSEAIKDAALLALGPAIDVPKRKARRRTRWPGWPEARTAVRSEKNLLISRTGGRLPVQRERGIPSRRCATMLRWICSVPPYTLAGRDLK